MNHCASSGFSSTVHTPPCDRLATHAATRQAAAITTLAALFIVSPALAQSLGRLVCACWRKVAEV